MNNVISQITKHQNIDKILGEVLRNLYLFGPVSTTDLEILTYLCIFAPDKFNENIDTILKLMGVFYKDVEVTNLHSVIFGMYHKHLKEKFSQNYTPVQASIIEGVENNECFSFSAPTSTGKSHVFRRIIESSNADVVIVVPSRALINEYYLKLCELIKSKSVNILTHIDKINTKNANRNVFVVTPERCKELFKFKDVFFIEYFLFDEAQLSNEVSTRGLYFDSIIRRIQKSYPKAKYVFAHPYVKNPDAQIIKNNFNKESSNAIQYTQKNVGQIFFSFDKGQYYHFGIEKSIMGQQKLLSNFDPLEKVLKGNGSILIYVTKASIYKKEIFRTFSKYIRMCNNIEDETAQKYINQFKDIIGGDDIASEDFFSTMISMLKRGIVIHHGSLPLQARLLLEQFTRKSFCKICFATSTLEQGINMPFDAVYINTFPASKPLSLKNIIGRAGRSTEDRKFDYGYVIMRGSNMSEFRNIMSSSDELNTVSLLDRNEEGDEDYRDFKDAIKNGTFSDEYNLTKKQLKKLQSEEVDEHVRNILDTMFENNQLVALGTINKDERLILDFYDEFVALYVLHLGRGLSDGEESVFKTGIKILLWKVYGKTLKQICWYRYYYAARVAERKHLRETMSKVSKQNRKVLQNKINNMPPKFITGYKDIPNKNLKNYSIYKKGEITARDVDYDRIVCDTYDYIDKLIGFTLSDIFYAVFSQYYEKTKDERSNKISKYFKYGTDKEREIWLLRYGFSFEDIEWIQPYVRKINQQEIVFKNSIVKLDDNRKKVIERFVY